MKGRSTQINADNFKIANRIRVYTNEVCLDRLKKKVKIESDE